jgi:hypothetical protein
MTSSAGPWVKYAILGLFVVLMLFVALSLALVYTSYSLSVSVQRITATMGAVVAQAESALATAQAVEAGQAEAVGTAVAMAETALAVAETALAAAQPAGASVQPTSTLPSVSPGPLIPLEGGAGITYQAADGPGVRLFPVDAWDVYKNYADFEADRESWPPDGPATVNLALIETQDGSGEWQLFHAGPLADTVVTPTEWSEYALLVELGLIEAEEGEDAGEPGLAVEGLVFDEGPGQKIVTSTLFTVEPGATTGDSVISLEDAGADPNLSSRLLLVDDSTGQTEYILIIFDPVSGSGIDRLRRYCSRCRGCYWFCRRIR